LFEDLERGAAAASAAAGAAADEQDVSITQFKNAIF
jgi:hypothetical protein